jgi:hypothetical protein
MPEYLSLLNFLAPSEDIPNSNGEWFQGFATLGLSFVEFKMLCMYLAPEPGISTTMLGRE